MFSKAVLAILARRMRQIVDRVSYKRNKLLRPFIPERVWLQREISRVYRRYNWNVEDARTAKERGMLDAELSMDMEDMQDRLDSIDTAHWVYQAVSNNVRRPPKPSGHESSEFWEYRNGLCFHVLTNEGKAAIRRELREELGWRREQRTAWALAIGAILSAVAALFGALAGTLIAGLVCK